MPNKRPRVRPSSPASRSPSPTLPLHLYTSLPSSTAASIPAGAPPDPALARLALRCIDAREATLLDPREVPRGRRADFVEWTGYVDGEGEGVEGGGQRTVHTDRHDLLHYLPSVPSIPSRASPPPPSGHHPRPGFDDLPSDHEEHFFLNSHAERLDLERRKKRRRLEQEREERVRERERQDADADADANSGQDQAPDPAGEVPPAILALMHRLHSTLSRSANPSLLELRVLANHGADERFASFLRREGRWRGVWERIRAGTVRGGGGGDGGGAEGDESGGGAAAGSAAATAASAGALGGLAAYGSDDDNSDEEAQDSEAVDTSSRGRTQAAAAAPDETPDEQSPAPPPAELVFATEEKQRERQEARAAKAREWAQRRREAREGR